MKRTSRPGLPPPETPSPLRAISYRSGSVRYPSPRGSSKRSGSPEPVPSRLPERSPPVSSPRRRRSPLPADSWRAHAWSSR